MPERFTEVDNSIALTISGCVISLALEASLWHTIDKLAGQVQCDTE